MANGIWSKMTGMLSGEQPGQTEEGGERRKDKTPDGIKFSVYMPSSYEEAIRLADAMKNGSGIVINGEYLDSLVYQRVIDFLDGAAYVIEGTGCRVSDTVQVYVPSSMEIVDEVATYYGNLNTAKKRVDA